MDGTLANNEAKLLLPDELLPRSDARGDVGAPRMALSGRLLAAPGDAIIAGDVRANENLALTATQTLFAREHNRIADALPTRLPEEEKFQIARRIVGAEQQWITYREFLPALGVDLPRYRGYDPRVDPSLSNEFAVVGYRAHSMIHGELEPSAPAGTYSAAQLDDFARQGIEVEQDDQTVTLVTPLNLAFENPNLLTAIGLGPVLKGIGGEREYRNDEQIDDQLRSVLFQVPKPGVPHPGACLDGPPLPDCFSGVVDLAALDIERGRDHGIPSYNALRLAYGLPAKTSFTAITGEPTDAFPPDPEIDRPKPIDDPDILDVLALTDANGDDIPLGTPEAANEAVQAASPHHGRSATEGDLWRCRPHRRVRRHGRRAAHRRLRARRAPARHLATPVREPAHRRPLLLRQRSPGAGDDQPPLRHHVQADARRRHQREQRRGRAGGCLPR